MSFFAIILNIILAYTLSRPSAYDVAGLAMAQSFVAAAEVVILFFVMLMRDHRLLDREFWNALYRILSVTGFTVITAFIMLSFFPLNSSDRGFITLGAKLSTIAFVTFAVHFGMSALFGLDEVKPVVSRVRKLILKPIKIQ